MNWLLWKEYRHNRPIVIAALLFLLTPHLIALYATCWEMHQGLISDPPLWRRHFCVSSVYSLILSQLVVAVIAGNAFAGERVDRSAEFLNSLPIARRRILASKLLLALIVVGTLWLIDGIAMLYLANRGGQMGPYLRDVVPILAWTAITASVFFSVGWLLSSSITSPTFAVCGGLGVPLVLVSGLLFIAYLFDLKPDEFVSPCYRWICLGIAPVCFALGTWLYLRRVEP